MPPMNRKGAVAVLGEDRGRNHSGLHRGRNIRIDQNDQRILAVHLQLGFGEPGRCRGKRADCFKPWRPQDRVNFLDLTYCKGTAYQSALKSGSIRASTTNTPSAPAATHAASGARSPSRRTVTPSPPKPRAMLTKSVSGNCAMPTANPARSLGDTFVKWSARSIRCVAQRHTNGHLLVSVRSDLNARLRPVRLLTCAFAEARPTPRHSELRQT